MKDFLECVEETTHFFSYVQVLEIYDVYVHTQVKLTLPLTFVLPLDLPWSTGGNMYVPAYPV
jgi:hypothetical protein